VGSKYNYRYFVVENHKFYFVVWISFQFNRTWNFVVILIGFSVKQRSTKFCIDFHIHIVVGIFYNIKNVMK
jgi:hypothetical protein